MTATQTINPKNVALIDARASVDSELAAIKRGLGIQTDEPATVLRNASHIYIHIDVDVLDPSEFDGHNMPEPNGLTIPQLVASLETLSGFNVIGAGITECVGTPDEVEVLSPVIEKLGELLRSSRT